MIKNKKGFTLIELMVVIALIGFLAAVVIVAVGSSQSRAKDEKIKSFLHQVRNAAELDFTDNETYDAVCNDSDNTLNSANPFGDLESAIKKINGNLNVTCIESLDKKSFAISSPLVSAEGKHWCIQSAGISIQRDDSITSYKCQ